MALSFVLFSAAAAAGGPVVSHVSVDAAWGTLSMVLLIAAGTFISEDLTCITTGLLIGRGELSPATGLLGCFVGIFLGDLGLWLIGRGITGGATRWPWLRSRLPHHALSRAAGWLDQHGPQVILVSRFVPGSRVPLYLAAGAIGQSAGMFMLWTFVAAAVWTPIIVLGTAWLGEDAVRSIESVIGVDVIPVIIAALLGYLTLRFLIALATPLGRAKLAAKVSKLWRWEFWPAWIFYLPLLPWLAWLSLRHRGFMTITAANPGMPHGGFVGESKSEILRHLPAEYVAPFKLIAPAEVQARVASVACFMATRGLNFPIILKPDAGQRGVGVRLARCEGDVRDYLAANDRPVLVQAYHEGPFEAGIFYVRIPGESRGRIFSITDKQFPMLTGDGESTLEKLIWRHPRFRMQAATFVARHAAERDRVLNAGETFRLAVAGNHCQGTMFQDGSHLITPQLEAAIDAVAREFDGFHFGRFDVRYRDVESFKAGRDFSIIELNGATSESTNLYDPSHSLFTAYRILFRQWSLLFQIASRNRRAGHVPSSILQVLREIIGHYRGRRLSLIAD